MEPAVHPLESILAAAVEIDAADERRAFVEQACAGDAELKRRVLQMIADHFQAGSFLEPVQLPSSRRGPQESGGPTLDEPILENPGAMIGPYKLMEQIGEGGFGLVFVAEQTYPVRRRVALKVIKPGMDTRQVIARFEAERQALALMDHPNIAKVLDADATAGGRPYFVMEFVKGVSITQFCDEQKLTPRQRLELFLSVCQAVQHAHQKGIIHRDLKPSNVLVTSHDNKPVVKVIDFGIAKAIGQQLTDKTVYTQLAQLIGTPLYMSPEQAGQCGLDVDTRSDIYSLGVLLYELLTGTTPFSKDRFKQAAYDEIRRIIREEDPPKPSTRLSELGRSGEPSRTLGAPGPARLAGPTSSLASVSAMRQTEPAKLTKLVRGELDWIVMKALEKDRNRRYETANGFAMDLQRYLADEPVQACPPSAWYRLRKFVRRNKGPVLAAMVLLVMLTAMLGLALVSNYQVNNALADRNDAFTKLEVEQENTAAALRRETAALTKQTEALGAKTKALEDLGQANATLKETFEREEQAAYQHRIALAHREWLANNPVRSLQLLKECPEKYRHWEWQFLHRLHHTDLLTLRAGYYVDDVAYSHDGRLLASVGAVAQVWEARTGRLLLTLSGPNHVHRVVFSPDGSRLATSGRDGSLRVWDAATGKQLVSIERPSGTPSKGLAFSADGRQIGCDGGKGHTRVVKFWDAATGKELSSWQPEPPPGGAFFQLTGVALSPDGKYMAVFGFSSIWLVEVQTKKAVPLNAPTSTIQRVVFSRDGSRLAAAGDNGHIRVWQVPTGNVLTTMHLSTDRIWGLAFSPDGQWLAAPCGDHSVQVVNAADGQGIMTLRGHTGVVNAAAFSPNGRQIASAGNDGTVRFWDITAPQEGPRLACPTGLIRPVAFSDDSQRLTTIGQRLLTWELNTGRNLFARFFKIAQPGKSIEPNTPALSRDGRYLALAEMYRGNLFVFEAKTGKEVFAQPGDKRETCDLAFSPDGRLLAEVSRDGWVTVRDAQTGRILQSLKGHRVDAQNQRLAFSPDGSRLASGSGSPSVKIWDTESWQELYSLDGHSSQVVCLAFSQDSRYVASGGLDKKICVWDTTTGSKLFDLSGLADYVTSVTFSPDKKRLFSGGSDGSINVWDVQNRVKLLTLHHRGNYVAISPDGRRLASCDRNSSTIQVWDSELLGREERWKRHQQRIPFWQPQGAAGPEKVVEVNPDTVSGYLDLGRASMAQGMLDEAVASYRKAVEIDPKNAAAYANLGQVLKQQKKWDEAAAAYRKSIELDPRNVSAHLNVGFVMSLQNKVDDALVCFRKVIELDPKHGEAHHRLGMILCDHKQDYAGAVAAFRQALALLPGQANLHFNLGLALRLKGDAQEAIAAHREAIRLAPTYAVAYAGLAHCLTSCADLKLRDPQKALEAAQKCAELAPQSGYAWFVVGRANYRLGDWKASGAAFKKAMDLQKSPGRFDAGHWFVLAMAHWQLGDKDEARRWYERANAWMEKQAAPNEELPRLRDEARKLLTK